MNKMRAILFWMLLLPVYVSLYSCADAGSEATKGNKPDPATFTVSTDQLTYINNDTTQIITINYTVSDQLNLTIKEDIAWLTADNVIHTSGKKQIVITFVVN